MLNKYNIVEFVIVTICLSLCVGMYLVAFNWIASAVGSDNRINHSVTAYLIGSLCLWGVLHVIPKGRGMMDLEVLKKKYYKCVDDKHDYMVRCNQLQNIIDRQNKLIDHQAIHITKSINNIKSEAIKKAINNCAEFYNDKDECVCLVDDLKNEIKNIEKVDDL